jgi:predicted GH43/DUF377 family glycosyl hydrolase
MHRTMRCLLLPIWLLAANTLTLAAQSWVIGPFMRPTEGPVIEPNKFYYFRDPLTHDRTYWEALSTFNPAATISTDGKVAVIFRAEDASGKDEIGGHTSRLGLATSMDGLQFTTEGAPVLYMANDEENPHEFPGGVEDPRIVVAPDGTYVMTYTQWARDQGMYTIGIATSSNLTDWKKWGPAFTNAGNTRFAKMRYKSGAILTELHNGRIQAVKVHGSYWMYWGEGKIGLATSKDLIHWTPVVDPQTNLPKFIMPPRPGHFDSGLAEVGPPPLLTHKGIVLIYNGKNSTGTGDETFPSDPKIEPGAYSVGEALFSSSDPEKQIGRTENPVLTPIWPYERHGQYKAGTTFAEGLVAYQGQLLLYYGAADSVIGVARAELPR